MSDKIVSATKLIRLLMLERDIHVSELAEKLGIKPQTMSNKLYRDGYSWDEVVKILNILDADIVVRTRDTNKEFR